MHALLTCRGITSSFLLSVIQDEAFKLSTSGLTFELLEEMQPSKWENIKHKFSAFEITYSVGHWVCCLEYYSVRPGNIV